MKNKLKYFFAGILGCTMAVFSFPAYAYASDGEDYITISVDAVDDSTNLKYALDSDDEEAFTDSNEFTVPAGTSHTIYVKDEAGNITSQKYEPPEPLEDYDDTEQQININMELGGKEDLDLSEGEGNPGTASVTNRTKTDGTVDAEKVFYTFTTKEGAELYLVVDQGRSSDNVYLLDTVSLGDLRTLADGQESSADVDDQKEDNLYSILTESEPEENMDIEPEEAQTEKPKSTFGNGLLILLLATLGGGGYYYLKIYKNKKDEAMDAMDAMDMDDFEAENDEDDEEMDFDYDDSEKERYLENLINDEEEFLDQDPNDYATSHMDDAAESAEGTESEAEDDEDTDMFDDIDEDF